MCGLVGVIGNLYSPDVKAFNELLYADFLRGNHATGVASIRGKHTRVLKKAWDPIGLMNHKEYDQVVSMTADGLIGHNRYGTIGDSSSHANAHPFEFGHIVGAHNGTLDTACVYGLHRNAEFGTDSEALYCEIAQNGIDEALTKIGGAWALTYFDKRDGSFNVLRNNQRPLFVAYRKDRQAMYWASEYELLYWILGRNKIEIEDGQAVTIAEDVHHKWEIGKKIGDPETRPLASSWVAPYHSHHRGTAYGWNPATQDWEDKKKDSPPFTPSSTTGSGKTGGSGSTTNTSGTSLTVYTNDPKDREFRPPYKDPETGEVLKWVDVQKIINENDCSYCGSDEAKYGDKLLLLKSHNRAGVRDFLCQACISDPDKLELGRCCA